MKICVFAAASEDVNEVYKCASYELGKAFANKSFTLVFGSGRTGLMGAVCRGLLDNNGSAIGVVPSFFPEDVLFSEKEIQRIRTETMLQRKQIMEDISDAFVVLPGGIGTIDEFFEILTLKQLKRQDKPILVLNTNGYYDKMLDMIQGFEEESFVSETVFGLFQVCQTPDGLVSALLDYKDAE